MHSVDSEWFGVQGAQAEMTGLPLSYMLKSELNEICCFPGD